MPQDSLQGASVYFWMIRNCQGFLHSAFETTEFDLAALPADDLKPESLKQGDDCLLRKPLELRPAKVRVEESLKGVQLWKSRAILHPRLQDAARAPAL